jgi:hypothetical protein
MRKISSLLAATGLAVAAMGVAAPAASASESPSEFCSSYYDFGFTHGACTSFLLGTPSSAGISSFCKRFESYAPELFHEFFANQGGCVSALNYYFKGGS